MSSLFQRMRPKYNWTVPLSLLYERIYVIIDYNFVNDFRGMILKLDISKECQSIIDIVEQVKYQIYWTKKYDI